MPDEIGRAARWDLLRLTVNAQERDGRAILDAEGEDVAPPSGAPGKPSFGLCP